MALFDQITHVSLKDCFEDKHGLLTFVVAVPDLGKAIGKGAVCVRRLEQLFKRRIRIIGFHPDLAQFVKYVIHPLQAIVEQEDTVLILKNEDRKTKSLLIGRNAQNLRNTESIIQRYFPNIVEVKVV